MAAKTTLAHRKNAEIFLRTRDELSAAEFNAMIAQGLSQAKSEESRPAEAVLHDLRKEVSTWR